MKEHEDHFKNFIEDDVTFEDYIANMSRDKVWGGNLEIQALSMRFNVNFYIHIYDHPMYIVKNFESPFKSIQLSYHEGKHYNSVRLIDDFEDDIPKEIPLSMINCVQMTSNPIPEHDEDEEESSEEKEEEREIEEDLSDRQEMSFFDTIVTDIKNKSSTSTKFPNSILTEEGVILNEPNDYKKCHCVSNKKYKNCCSSTDLKGEYDKKSSTFYCDLEKFKAKFGNTLKRSSSNNQKEKNEVDAVTKGLEKIFI